MDRTKQNKKDLTKVNSDRVELIYFNNRVVKVPVISVALSDGGTKQTATQKKDPSKLELQELGLELNVPSYSSQFHKKVGSASEPTELLVEQEALDKLNQNELNHIKVVHNRSVTAAASQSNSTTPATKKATITSSKPVITKKNVLITPKGKSSSNQRRSKSAPPKNVKSTKSNSKSSTKLTPSVQHFLTTSKGAAIPRLLVDVTSTSHQTKKPSTIPKTTTKAHSTVLSHSSKLPSQPDQQSRIPIFSLSSSSDESDYDYTFESINNRINSQLRTSSVSSVPAQFSTPKTEERGRAPVRTADRMQMRTTPSKSNPSTTSVNTLIRDTKEVMQKEKLQRERIKEVLSAAPVLKNQEEESSQPIFRTPQPPASRMQQIKQMIENQRAVTSDSETEDEMAQQRMQAFLQRIRKTPSMEEIPVVVQAPPQKTPKKKVEKEEDGLTDREERIKLKEKLVDEKASSLKKLRNDLEYKELEIFKLQEETLGEIEKQKERLRKKELKLRKFQEKMKLVNALESDLDDGTSSASEWRSSKQITKAAKTESNQNVRIIEDAGKTKVMEPTQEIEDIAVQSEEEFIKNEIDKRILELRNLLDAKRIHKEGQNSSS